MNRLPKRRILSLITIFYNATSFAVTVSEDQKKLSTFCWLPKLHKQPYIRHDLLLILAHARLPNYLVLLLSKIMLFNIVKKYMKGPVKTSFGQSNSCEELNKLKSRGFRAPSLSTYDFSTLYTILPHNLIKDKQVDFIARIFQGEGSLYCM